MNKLFFACALVSLTAYGNISNNKEQYRISCTCKAESVIDLFPKKVERQKAIDWFKKHGVSRVWIETFRHGRFADEELLRTVKNDFEAAGIETFGAICPTSSSIKSLFNCSTNIVEHKLMGEVSRLSAKIFDTIILDDFLFSTCACDGCKKEKGKKSWSEFNAEFLLKLNKRYIYDAAKKVRSDVKIIIKYPCWYEWYYHNGYDVVNESRLYGHTWIGTETREPDDEAGGFTPQTQASWLQGWANDFSNGNCGGGWIDPLGTKPETFVEQARQTILGGAKELLIHCYDYLGTTTPGIAFHGNGKVPYGLVDAEAFRKEKDKLIELGTLLKGYNVDGILSPKIPNKIASSDFCIPVFIGMLGFPTLPSINLKDSKADFLIVGGATKEETIKRILENRANKKPTLLTFNMAKNLSLEEQRKIGLLEGWIERKRDSTFIDVIDDLLVVIGSGTDRWDMMDLSGDDLNKARNILLKPYGIKIDAPTRVSLHLFNAKDNSGKRLLAIENFNNNEVEVSIELSQGNLEMINGLIFPNEKSVISSKGKLTFKPRSMALMRLQ